MALPVTRYYGSKRKLVERIWEELENRHLEYQSFLDVFGGTGIMSYNMAKHGKDVVYNDIFTFNCKIAEALLASPRGVFTNQDAAQLILPVEGREYQHFIEEIFRGIYYRNDEDRTIDTVAQNILHLPQEQQASAYYILFQSCIIKRPFNLFHRRNLNLRENHTKSNFGNYVTWEKGEGNDYKPTTFYDDNGKEIELNKGKTMIFIIKEENSFSVDGVTYDTDDHETIH